MNDKQLRRFELFMWFGGGFLVGVLLGMPAIAFAHESVGVWLDPHALLTPELDGPPLLVLLELLAGPLWWIFPLLLGLVTLLFQANQSPAPTDV